MGRGRDGERERERDRIRDRVTELELSCTGLLPKMPAVAGAGYTEAGSQEVNLGLPCRWQELDYLSHHLLPAKRTHWQEA